MILFVDYQRQGSGIYPLADYYAKCKKQKVKYLTFDEFVKLKDVPNKVSEVVVLINYFVEKRNDMLINTLVAACKRINQIPKFHIGYSYNEFLTDYKTYYLQKTSNEFKNQVENLKFFAEVIYRQFGIVNLLVNNQYESKLIESYLNNSSINLEMCVLPKYKFDFTYEPKRVNNKILIIGHGDKNWISPYIYNIIPNVIHELQNYEFYFMGRCFDRGTTLIKNRIFKSDLNRCHFLGFVSNEEKNQIYEECSYAIIPNIETYSWKCIELINHRMRIVTTDINKGCDSWFKYATSITVTDSSSVTFDEISTGIIKYFKIMDNIDKAGGLGGI